MLLTGIVHLRGDVGDPGAARPHVALFKLEPCKRLVHLRVVLWRKVTEFEAVDRVSRARWIKNPLPAQSAIVAGVVDVAVGAHRVDHVGILNCVCRLGCWRSRECECGCGSGQQSDKFSAMHSSVVPGLSFGWSV